MLAALLALCPLALAAAPPPTTHDLTNEFCMAGLSLDEMLVVEVGGIVVIRGTTSDPVAAAQAGDVAARLGYARVANLIHVRGLIDDAAIARSAERTLANDRQLNGCAFSVECKKGIVHLSGRVWAEVQKDIAVRVLRRLAGVLDVHSRLVNR